MGCMDNVLRVPIDLTGLPQFRVMEERLGFAGALAAWFILWRELGYRAQEGGAAGRLELGDVGVVRRELEQCRERPADSESRAGDAAVASRTGAGVSGTVFDLMVEARLLVKDGEEYACPRFAVLHGTQLSPSRSLAQQGGDMRAFSLRQKRAEQVVMQQSLALPESRFVDEEGRPLDGEAVRRVMRLIVSCDNALFREARANHGFTEGLIAQALAVLKKYVDEEIDYVCRSVAKKRGHPALSGMTTEKMLDAFGSLVEKLG
jgi:hypothetical protein